MVRHSCNILHPDIKEYNGWEFRVFHYKIFEFKDTLPHDFEVNKYNYVNNMGEQNNEQK